MKTRNLIIALASLAMCAFLSSFVAVSPGGESYTLFINDKLMIEHYFTSKASLPALSVADANATDRISVYYNECGKIGTSRRLSVRDEQGTILKEWRYDDAVNAHTPLTCKVGDIQKLGQPGSNKLKLYYSSKEVSDARALASLTVTIDKRSVAGR